MIKELYAWVVQDPTGKHGVIAFSTDIGEVQAVASKRSVIDKTKPMVEEAFKQLGITYPVHLVRFQQVEVIDEIKPPEVQAGSLDDGVPNHFDQNQRGFKP